MNRFAVIGHPVAHSLSPKMHAANFRALNFAGEYGAVDVEPGHVAEALTRFAADGYTGINVTVPHKIEARDAMTRLDASAVRAGAVNTVRFEADGTTTGFNTDMAGFARPLTEAGFNLQGARVLLLGAGGAAQAVAAACLDGGCAALMIANRTRARAEALVGALADARATACTLDALTAADCTACRLIVNCTTVGLKEGDPPVLPAAFFGAGQFVYDIIPCARETATLAAARAAGARTLGGLGMLAAQAAESFRIWTGRDADLNTMRAALVELQT